MTPVQPLVILGASARSAAWSAIRAGYSPIAIDRFQDLDLQAACPSQLAMDYPTDLLRLASEIPACPWIYTGALENHPDLVDKITASRPLYGNTGDILRQVRNPLLVAQALSEGGLPYLEVCKLPPVGRAKREWLRKPLDSCGGGRISLADDEHLDAIATRAAKQGAFYFQRLADGQTASALYVAHRDGCLLLGVTEQLVGQSWTGGRGFQYCGSIGPLPLSPKTDDLVRRIGDCVSGRFGLRGLFGIDFIIADDAAWLVEVNPRYTASVEVAERIHGIAAVASHVAACRGEPLSDAPAMRTDAFAGKAIVYAAADGFVPEGFGDLARRFNTMPQWPRLADIPPAGTRLQTGHPIATVLASGDSLADVRRRLRELVRQVQKVVRGGMATSERS